MIRTKITRGRNFEKKKFPVTIVITDKNRGEEYEFSADVVQIDFKTGNRSMEYTIKALEYAK